MRSFSYLIILFLMVLASCVKPPDYSVVPRIEFVSVNKTDFNEMDPDSLSVVIYFEDGDGDLGSEDSVNMFWEDSRVPGYLIPYKIPFFNVDGNSKAISGTVTTYYRISSCYSDTDPIDTFYFKIFVEDRAGNQSNVDSTSLIFIHCN